MACFNFCLKQIRKVYESKKWTARSSALYHWPQCSRNKLKIWSRAEPLCRWPQCIIWRTHYQPGEHLPSFDLKPKDPLTVKHFQRVVLMPYTVYVCDSLGHSVGRVHKGVLVPWWSILRSSWLPSGPHAWFLSRGNDGTGVAVRTGAQTNLSPHHIVQICPCMILHAPIQI